MIDAAPSPPYPALLLQIFRDAKYMLDVRVAPLYGALVMTNEAWNKIEPTDRPAVVAAAKALEKRMLGEAPEAGRRLGGDDEDARADGQRRSTRKTRPRSAPKPRSW